MIRLATLIVLVGAAATRDQGFLSYTLLVLFILKPSTSMIFKHTVFDPSYSISEIIQDQMLHHMLLC